MTRDEAALRGRSHPRMYHRLTMSDGQYTERLTERFIEDADPRPPNGRRLLLYDFDTGEADLLPRHLEALNRIVIPLLAEGGHPHDIWIAGLASRRGDVGLNRSLAFGRAMQVEQYILARAPHVRNFASRRHSLTTRYFGERHSTHHTENSEYYRSVLIVMTPAALHQPEPRPPEPAPIQTTNRFNIRLLWGIEGGEVLAVGNYVFIIDYEGTPEQPASDPTAYRLWAGGAGVGLPAGFSQGAHNDSNLFTAHQVTTTRGFEGQARLVSWAIAGAWGPSYSRSTLRLMPSSSEHIIDIDPFNSSHTFGVGASTIQGRFYVDHEITQLRARQRNPR